MDVTASAVDRLGLIASPAALARIGARVVGLEDPEVRAAAIAADHPEFERALREGRHEAVVDGQPVSIRLHLSMHEIVANQLADDDPAEVFATAQRLLADGYERHEILHMLAAPVVEQILTVAAGREGYDRERHCAALAPLPGSWEQRRQQRAPDRAGPRGRGLTSRQRR